MGKRYISIALLALLVLVALRAPAWARPGQRPDFQTVPTPTPPERPSPTIPPQPTQPPLPTKPPHPTQLPPSTATPGPQPTPMATPSPTIGLPTPSPSSSRVVTVAPGSTSMAGPTPTAGHPSAGPGGGGISYRWKDGSRVVVSVPSGCMKETLWLSIQPLTMPDAPARVGDDWLYPSRLGMVLDAWHASTGKPFPRSDTLPCPWEIRLTPSKAAVSPVDGNLGRVRLAWYDESAGRWVALKTKTAGRSVVAETEHTGAFGLMLVPPPGPPETLPDTGADRGWIVVLATIVAALLAMAVGALAGRRRTD